MTPFHVLIALSVILFWGANFVVVKVGLEDIPPFLLITFRFALVAIFLVPFVPRPPRDRIRAIAAYAIILGVLHFGLMFSAIQYVEAGLASLLVQVQVPMAAILAAIFQGDRIGWRRALGIALAMTGVGVLVGGPTTPTAVWPVIGILAASLMWAIANLQMKALSDVNGFTLNGWMAVFATPPLAVLSLILEEDHMSVLMNASLAAYGALIYQAVIVVILSYALWYWLLARYSVGQIVPFTLLLPFVGVISGMVFFGEALTVSIVLGGMITVAGVAIITIRRPRLADRTTQDR